MKETIAYSCKAFLTGLSRKERLELLESSNLTDIEISVMIKRFVNGKSIKECCMCFNIEEGGFNKKQRKILNKLYQWLIDEGYITCLD